MSGHGKDPQLTVIGYAMWTAAGHDGPSSVAAMRAGVSPATVTNLWDSIVGEELAAFRLTSHQWWEGPTFVPQMIAPVIRDCQAWLVAQDRPTDVPVIINLAPPDRPNAPEDLRQIVLDGVSPLLEGGLPQGSFVVTGGRAGMPHMLDRAAGLSAPCVILVGAESLLSQPIVEAYNTRRRILSSANSNGFIVGEAAAAVIVAKGRQPGLVLTGMGVGHEPGLDGGSKDAPTTGTGLTDAMRAAMRCAHTNYYDINVLMGDLNGEHFKFKEHTLATMRLGRMPEDGRSRRPREYVEHWNVVETIGEVGAALMPAAIGWAYEAGRSGYLPGRALFTAGEDDGRRAAVIGEWVDG